VLANSINLILPTIIARVIDEYTTTQTIATKYYTIAGIALVIGTTFTFLNTYLNAILGEKIGKDLKDRLFKKVLRHNYSYLVETKPSKILTVINSDTIYIKNTFTQAIGMALMAIFLLIGSVILMFSLNQKLALIIVIAAPTIIGLLVLVLKNKFKLFREVQKLRDKLNKVITENIKASMLIKVFVSEKVEIKKFKKVNTQNKILGLEINKIFSIVVPSINALSIIAMLFILYFGGQEVIYGNMTIGDVTAFNNYVGLFTAPLLMLGLMSTMLGQAFASLGRINGILNAPITFKDGTEHIETFENLEVKNLSLKIADTDVLKDINFAMNKNQKIGILGLTGSGKTVFLKTLLRALEPTSGNILINEEDIKNYKIKDIRKLIGFSFQENFLFNGTIFENIKFGRDINDKEIFKAGKIAEVDEFTKKTDKKYKTKVGERGNNLSGGQKQRVMIARALASNPQILILDDATSRLDIETEKKVFENIKKEYKDISIILVAQKIVSVKDCDRIYIFDNGHIAESGTHEELLKNSVLYQEIELTQRNHG
ncbi:MAG: ABC transporter ATP-binding protein, partial [Candidatus Dojkabacteria bacterium]|nr:ABC transporter ATP-binding protein [Candidatus Dojkabacteria bacterium]